MDPRERVRGVAEFAVPRAQVAVDTPAPHDVLGVVAAGVGGAAEHAEVRLSRGNAKLLYRTVLTIRDAAARHVVPLKRRKSTNPLTRRPGSV